MTTEIGSLESMLPSGVSSLRVNESTVRSLYSPQKIEAFASRAELAVAREDLQTYLKTGQRDSWYKDGNVRYIDGQRLREKVLRAGYTEFALGSLNSTGITEIGNRDQKYEQRVHAEMRSPNRYNLTRGYFDGVEAVQWLLDNKQPDYPSGRDPLRQRLLKEIDEAAEIRRRLLEKGESILSLSRWEVMSNGTTIFWLNPGYGDAHHGNYTLSELKGWLNNNPRSVVLKENHKNNNKEKIESKSRSTWKTRYSQSLGRLAKRTDKEGERLFRIALMGCPFDDLVTKYYRQTI